MVDVVNTSQSVLEQIGSEGDDPDSVDSVVTVDQINMIRPGIEGVDPDNESLYQDYIDANPDLFSNPATIDEIQAMVDAVNTSQSVLEQIGSEGDDPDVVVSTITIEQINSITPGIEGVDPNNESLYQDYIDNYPDLFSSPATFEEVQDMVDILNYDNDEDGVADAHDLDDDNDGILDSIEDNGDPERDTDGDGILDRFDLDSDGDGILDLVESGQNSSVVDTNGDGVLDSDVDADNDGVLDTADADDNDINAGGTTVPTNTDDDNILDFQDFDSDNDGISDLVELGADLALDTDNDGILNYLDPDDDNDGVLTIDENTGDCDFDGISNHLDDTDCNLIPEGFSPNGDGVNDEFVIPLLVDYPGFSMEIYNRYGRKVYNYENNLRTNPLWWNGYVTGVSLTFSVDKMVPVGSYYYIISLNDSSNKQYTGWVYINR
jgi:gliding motility-associated-like protein